MNEWQNTEIFQLFGGYFNQDYDVMVENFDRTQPIVPQLTRGYKKGRTQKYVNKAIQELENLIEENYSEDSLDNTIFGKLGIALYPPAIGFTHKQFLREVLKVLKE